MEGRYLVIADYAEFSPTGRLNLIGGDIEEFTFAALPACTPPFKIAGKVHLSLAEKDADHQFQLIIKDPDGDVISDVLRGTIARMNRDFKPKSPYAGLNVLFTCGPLGVSKEGKYDVIFLIDNNQIIKTSFYVFTPEI